MRTTLARCRFPLALLLSLSVHGVMLEVNNDRFACSQVSSTYKIDNNNVIGLEVIPVNSMKNVFGEGRRRYVESGLTQTHTTTAYDAIVLYGIRISHTMLHESRIYMRFCPSGGDGGGQFSYRVCNLSATCYMNASNKPFSKTVVCTTLHASSKCYTIF